MPGPGSANVQSLDALRDVRLALMAYGERTEAALADLRTKIDRTLAWLEQDRPMYWREQERKAYDSVASTRIAYETCRMRTVGGRHSECIEEKIAHQRAKMRLEFCQRKMEVVRRWTAEARQQADEYRGRSGPLHRCLEDEIPNLVAALGRMIESLEAYADIRSDHGEQSVSLGSTESTELTGDEASTQQDGTPAPFAGTDKPTDESPQKI
jgi:hypothetical protein